MPGKRPSPSKKAHKSRDARTKKRKSPYDSSSWARQADPHQGLKQAQPSFSGLRFDFSRIGWGFRSSAAALQHSRSRTQLYSCLVIQLRCGRKNSRRVPLI